MNEEHVDHDLQQAAHQGHDLQEVLNLNVQHGELDPADLEHQKHEEREQAGQVKAHQHD